MNKLQHLRWLGNSVSINDPADRSITSRPITITMFQCFPKQRQDWMREFEFPFQAFVVLAPISYWLFMRLYGYYANDVSRPCLYSFDYMGAGQHLSTLTAAGYLLCFLALMGFGFYHRAAKRRTRSYVSLFTAALSVIDLIIMPLNIFAVATS
jgi:hypothetical protein